MSNLSWDPLAINALLFSLLGTTIVLYFLARVLAARRAGAPTEGLTPPLWIFGMAAITAVLDMLSHVLPPDPAAWVLPWVSPFGCAAMAAFILFTERLFGAGVLSRRGRILLWLLLGGIVGAELAIAIIRSLYLVQGSVLFRDAWIRTPFALGFVVAAAFCFANLANALQPSGTRDGPRGGARAALRALLSPRIPVSGTAGAARGFFYFSLTPVALGLVLFARSSGLMDWTLTETVVSWLVLLIFSGFIWVFLSYLPERSDTTTKITAMVLVALLMIISALSWLVAPAIVGGFTDPGGPRAGEALRFAPQPGGGYVVEPLAARRIPPETRRMGAETDPITLPFDLPVLGQTIETLYVRDAGLVGLGALPRLDDIRFRHGPEAAIFVLAARLTMPDTPAPGQGVFVDLSDDRALITWADMAIEDAPGQRYDAQLTLHADGTIDIAWHALPLRPAADLYHPDSLPMMIGLTPGSRHGPVLDGPLRGRVLPPGTGAIDDRRPAFRAAMTAAFGPLAAFLLVAVPGLLLLFSLLVHLSVKRPLTALAEGVERVRGGTLDRRIPVFAQDEIGALALAFNEMAEAREQLLQSLEAEVELRAAEAVTLSARNARLQEREDLGRDLHDAVSQTLFAAGLIADSVPRLMHDEQARAVDAVRQVAGLNRSALVEMRRLLMQLRSQELLERPFGTLLPVIAQEMERSFGLKVSVAVDSDTRLPEVVQYTFFRVAHAALSNVARHAGVDHAEVSFDAVDGQAMLSVTDHGAGFDPAAVPPGHHGLTIMRERLDKLGGLLEVETAPGRGCTITAIWFSESGDDDDTGDAD